MYRLFLGCAEVEGQVTASREILKATLST